MKIAPAKTGDGFTIFASLDELRLNAVALSEFRATAEERGLARKMAQQCIAALPASDDDEPDDDDDLYADDKPAGDDDDDI